MYRVSDKTLNMCDICVHDYATCDSINTEFGCGVGNDNIVGCGNFSQKLDTICDCLEMGEIVKKEGGTDE